jgi:hypothetical protein
MSELNTASGIVVPDGHRPLVSNPINDFTRYGDRFSISVLGSMICVTSSFREIVSHAKKMLSGASIYFS